MSLQIWQERRAKVSVVMQKRPLRQTPPRPKAKQRPRSILFFFLKKKRNSHYVCNMKCLDLDRHQLAFSLSKKGVEVFVPGAEPGLLVGPSAVSLKLAS